MNLRVIGVIAAMAALAVAFWLAVNAVAVRRASAAAKPDWTPQQKQEYLETLAEPSFFRVVEKGALEGGSTFMLLKFDGGDRVFIYKYPGFAPAMVAMPSVTIPARLALPEP